MISYYLKWLQQRTRTWIESEFFRPQWSGAAASCRLCLGIACVLFFSSWYGSVDTWIGSKGPLNADLTRFLIGDGLEGSGSGFRLSPFFLYDNPIFIITYLLTATFMALVMISGFGGRWIPFLVWVMMLGLLHRISMLQSLGEILLCSILPYLIIDTGWLREPTRVGFADNKKRWTTGLMLTMMRWHLMIWISVSLLSHMSQEMWWNGTAIWRIAASGQSPYLSPDYLANHDWLISILGNLWLILHVMFLIALSAENIRPLSIVIGIIFWLAAYMLTCDWIYSMAGLAALSCTFYDSSLTLKRLRFASSPASL